MSEDGSQEREAGLSSHPAFLVKWSFKSGLSCSTISMATLYTSHSFTPAPGTKHTLTHHIPTPSLTQEDSPSHSELSSFSYTESRKV